MPIYEWRCGRGHVFEALVPATASSLRGRCPVCGKSAARMFSAFAIQSGATLATASERAASREVDVTKLAVPSFARPCGMDDYSAARFAAHKLGRGAEFDDKMATRQQQDAAQGKEAPKAKAGRAHKHNSPG